ncbi:MAG: tRNA (adenosine(37)-N6)-threonylcarbamoyltransferase complex ATPase subunit type 1 TsaE [Gammaproteobacteria bacterium]|nr:tRNA (adenosine(37)-N6)-threonylcarbamoyltransferase complex ATPase subunit type 1 TsaE [Gammaproteobacteria bacterium]
MKRTFATEEALGAGAAAVAVAWRDAAIAPLLVGLVGELGAGKTAWARAMLRGLGHAGRVPSPTYTLLEHYEIGALTVVHLDLYRLNEAQELDFLGLRDWLAVPNVWILAEWPERSDAFAASLDLTLALEILPEQARAVTMTARTERGRAAAAALADIDFK